MIDILRSTLGHFVILPTLLIANIDIQVTRSVLLHEYFTVVFPHQMTTSQLQLKINLDKRMGAIRAEMITSEIKFMFEVSFLFKSSILHYWRAKSLFNKINLLRRMRKYKIKSFEKSSQDFPEIDE